MKVILLMIKGKEMENLFLVMENIISVNFWMVLHKVKGLYIIRMIV